MFLINWAECWEIMLCNPTQASYLLSEQPPVLQLLVWLIKSVGGKILPFLFVSNCFFLVSINEPISLCNTVGQGL